MVKYCGHCGTACDANMKFCQNCGAAFPAPSYQQPVNQGYQQPVNQSYQQPVNQGYNQLNQQPELPMKWFKFVIYVQLFLNALSNIGTAIMTMTGTHYGDEADRVYEMVEGLQTFDMFYGVLLIAVAVFAIYARSRLAKFCKNGPDMYYGVLAAGVAVSLLYVVGVSMLVADSSIGKYYEPDYSGTFTSIAVTTGLIAANVTYFGKRKHLFVNN